MAARGSAEWVAAQLAREHLQIEHLEERGRDHLDFHDVGVVGLRHALGAAYAAGRAVALAGAAVAQVRAAGGTLAVAEAGIHLGVRLTLPAGTPWRAARALALLLEAAVEGAGGEHDDWIVHLREPTEPPGRINEVYEVVLEGVEYPAVRARARALLERLVAAA